MKELRTLQACTVLALGCLALGCGEGPEPAESTPGSAIETVEQFATWNPGATLDQQHVDWHTRPCSVTGQPLTGQVGVGRRCSRPGEDFLLWHRNYLERLRDEYERQRLTSNIAPWYRLPPEMKDSRNGWTAALQTAETNIRNLVNGSGQRFASLDEFGTYLENFYHNSLHAIAQRAYGESVVGGFMSPRSTYFFKIHGLVEHHLQRFLLGDFNWDGRSDAIIRNTATGANRIGFMNDGVISSSVNISSVGIDGCQWYLGATADLNFDGWLDLIWHGRGCSAVHAWIMNGTNYVRSEILPAVNGDWTLVGAGDFNADLRPDLAWSHNASKDLSIWVMNGTQLVRGIGFDVPDTYETVLVGPIADSGTPDLLYRRWVSGFGWDWAFEWMRPDGLSWGQAAINGMSAYALNTPSAVGRYQNTAVPADFLFFRSSAAPDPFKTFEWFVSRKDWPTSSSTSITTYANSGTNALGYNETVVGPR